MLYNTFERWLSLTASLAELTRVSSLPSIKTSKCEGSFWSSFLSDAFFSRNFLNLP